jgi:myo-inositol-1(or 4)-monophosphatase
MLDFAVSLAREAGEILLEHHRRVDTLRVERKGRIDLVTEADLASEEHLRSRIRAAYPEHDLVVEEGQGTSRGAEYRWFVDPLDGTINFVRSHPMFAVSLALEHRGRMILGVVHAPRLGELFAAEAGRGARLNDRPIHVSTIESLEESVVATGFAYGRAELPDNNVDNFARIVLDVRGIRRGGAAALDLCYVAAGRFDGFWELHLSPWDVAAGACIVREAGGDVTDFRGGSDWLFGRHLVASNGRIHGAIRSRLSPLRGL